MASMAALMPMINGGPPTPDMVEVMRYLEMGLVTTIFWSGKRPERRTLKVKLESRQLMWIKSQAARPEGTGEQFIDITISHIPWHDVPKLAIALDRAVRQAFYLINNALRSHKK